MRSTASIGTGTEVELTRGWAVYAAYDHIWVPGKWRTSLYGGYIAVSYNDTATALISNATCGPQGSNAVGAFPGAGAAGSNLAPAGTVTNLSNCDPDWALAYIGSRTQYNFTPDFYMGIDVIYTKLSTAFAAPASTGHSRAPLARAASTPSRTRTTWPSRSASIATSSPDRLEASLNPNPRRRPRRGFCFVSLPGPPQASAPVRVRSHVAVKFDGQLRNQRSTSNSMTTSVRV